MDNGWLGWTAGIIDGEGSIGISQTNTTNREGKYRFHPHIQVGNTDKNMIEKLVELWGGRVSEKAYDKRYEGKRLYGWYLPSRNLIKFGEAILPYLVTKKEHMELALEVQKRIKYKIGIIAVMRKFNKKRGCHPSMWLTSEERKYRGHIRNKLISINQHGAFPAKLSLV